MWWRLKLGLLITRHSRVFGSRLVFSRARCFVVSAMTHAAHVDGYVDDRGLSTCFTVANVLPEWSKELVTKYRWETLEDCVHWFDDAQLEDSLSQVLLGTTLKDNRLARSRIKAARAAGVAAIKTATSVSKPLEAPDEVLPDSIPCSRCAGTSWPSTT